MMNRRGMIVLGVVVLCVCALAVEAKVGDRIGEMVDEKLKEKLEGADPEVVKGGVIQITPALLDSLTLEQKRQLLAIVREARREERKGQVRLEDVVVTPGKPKEISELVDKKGIPIPEVAEDGYRRHGYGGYPYYGYGHHYRPYYRPYGHHYGGYYKPYYHHRPSHW